MIGIGIGVSWAKQAISVVTNLIVSFKARVASYPNSIFEAEACLAGQLTELNRDGLLNGASLVITPNAYNEGVLYDVVPNTTLGDMNVVRATTGTIVNSAGLIQEVPYNLLTYSQYFNDASWTKSLTTITENTTVSPNGALDASTMNISGSGSNISKILTLGPGTYTFSFYVKKLSLSASGTMRLLGTVDGASATLIFTPTNEWVRYTSTFTASTSLTNVQLRGLVGTGNVAIWGAQLVTGSVAKDYFPTTTRLNIPRLDYTGSTCPSILIEPQRTNLFLNSVLTGTGTTPTSWSAGFTTGTSAPATSTMSTIGQAYTFTTSASRQVINQSLSYVSGTTYACSVYVENVTGTIPITEVLFFNGTGTHTFYKDGVLISSSTAVVSGSRYTAVFSATATLSQQVRVGNGCTTSTTGSIRLSMPQLEVGANATSYIPTTTATVTRNADVISKTEISSLIGQTEGTLYVEVNVNNWTNLSRIFSISDGTSTNRIMTLFNTSNRFRVIMDNSGGAAQADISSSSLSNGIHKLAVGYKSNDFVFYVDGVLIGSDTSATIPACSAAYLGKIETSASSNFLDSGIKSAALWKTRLTNAELAALTKL